MEKYLILDTNIWIYLCNARPYREGNELCAGNPHIKMFNHLKRLCEQAEVVVLTNDLILKEWEANKNASRDYIKILGKVRKERKKNLKHENDQSRKSEIIKDIDILDNSIKENEKHVIDVENFLKNDTRKYPITVSSKLLGADHAIEKKAPFKSKNSMADMVILLSGIEYIRDSIGVEIDAGNFFYPESQFISGNYKDFSMSENNKEIIHPDLAPYMEVVNMGYSLQLGEYINELSGAQVLSPTDLDDYNKFIFYEQAACPHCDDDWLLPEVTLCKEVTVWDANKTYYQEKQMRFSFLEGSADDLNKGRTYKSYEGECNICGTLFIKCCICDSLIEVCNGIFRCNTCESIYKAEVAYAEKDIVYDWKYTLVKEVSV